MEYSLFTRLAAEFVGTAVLMIFGNGAVANVELKNTKGHNAGWINIAMGYGFGVMFPVLMFGGVSGAHINPAMTLAQAVNGMFPWSEVLPYICAQILGAAVGQLIVYICYYPHYKETESAEAILGTFCTTDAYATKRNYFINEFIESVRTGKAADFRTKYREADLLLVDDIQFVAGKVETQNEFFHTFNALYEAKKQIVLTSDRPPQEMAQLDDRLRTRFEWGLMADVQPPVLETRVAILKNKAAQLGFILSDEIAGYIASKITANVRQLEGTVKKIKAFKDLDGIEINTAAVDRALQDMSRSNEFIITPETIIKEVCRYFRLEEDQIKGQSRSRDSLNARQTAMYLIRRLTSLSLDDTGKVFGGRDHSTVLNSINKVEKKMKADPTYAETVKAIITNINSTK